MTKKKMVEFTTVTDYQQTFRICLTDIWEEICKEQYFEMSEEEQHKHLEYYAWEAVEHYDGYKLSNIIDNLAEHIIQKIYPIKTEEPQ